MLYGVLSRIVSLIQSLFLSDVTLLVASLSLSPSGLGSCANGGGHLVYDFISSTFVQLTAAWLAYRV